VKQLRSDAKVYLKITDPDYPLSKIFRKLNKHRGYTKKRELKEESKQADFERRESLQNELKQLNLEIGG
jgi:hypothetical protein